MHIVIGGAFNGKRAYVKQLIDAVWYEQQLPESVQGNIVIAGLEGLLRAHLEEEEEQVAAIFAEKLRDLNAQSDELIVILTDMGRGVVPLEKEQRQLRDTCGRLYQLLFNEATTITRIWYGLPEILKKGME
ncbi:bifunctional adenosylcobinamide kinase/adenosylcobinamide-phosphate guanylyltransferase [Kurthia huakuii]|jgi:adenosylcobinamide kinase/adenosylcobinamide-phosphate guanylyltransferase|uniref:bifunctional adenosylcobinamide kinase/adenosylcobinamide-phosphate guanylyltransferase n=1 Tax=Kurthia huakuii TaxID=1421019 RepID=UPI00049762E4|nr:bifunctional adenosylcobinamide kinase/adenosylcobinamide-phosphate guanylyltransferase [Kurthia huakuii]MBM7698904.1 adenosyl cobinamide kinase/adenosyl cobinamide phosphate guanylyltransferase [Kurthia huakuii]